MTIKFLLNSFGLDLHLRLKVNNIDSGSTLTENLVSIVVLSVILAAMIPMFMYEKGQNTRQRILTGAVSLSKETLDDLRRQEILKIPLGQSTTYQKVSGYPYKLTKYVCTQEPSINTNNYSVTCPTTINSSSNLRHIFVKIEKNDAYNDGTPIYSVQTVYTKLR